jgi:peroxiredoxin
MSTPNVTLSVGDRAPDVTLPDDRNRATRLSELWRRQPIVLVFVRHSGCTLCLDHAVVMREAYPEIQAAGAEVVLVTMDDPARLHAFKEHWQLPFVCLADPKQEGYRAFQCPRGSWLAVAGPSMWWRAIKSLFRHGAGLVRGDPLQLPGSFIIDRDGMLRFVHRSRHSADWASPDQLLDALRALPNHGELMKKT